jgi:8-oxo-dGTP pyrophosphatase MutT (NUDIX family)
MPKAASKKQYRFMMAIIHGKGECTQARGCPPKSVAAKYSGNKDAPESKDNNRGGDWTDKHHKAHTDGKKKEKSSKKSLKKAFDQYYNGRGVGVIVTDDSGKVLVGKGDDGKWQTPGGHVEPDEEFQQAAVRELEEETHVKASKLREVGHAKINGNDSKVFHTSSFSGTPRDTEELKDLQFASLSSILDWDLRDCSRVGLEMYARSSLNKSKKLSDMVLLEKLNKNIMRGGDGRSAVMDVSHGEALRLVGNGCFRMLQQATGTMSDEDFKDVKIDSYTISIRKHMNDVYSGRITDGHKVIHQFTNKSLPQLCADVMSVFEWYSDEDEKVFDILDEQSLSDDAIFGGLEQLSENYKKHNIANIYTEMENIRKEIRTGNAVDLQQVEDKIMKLFDKLENSVLTIVDNHNRLNEDAGTEIESLEAKLRELQEKVDELSKKPSKVEVIQSQKVDPKKIYDNQYMYLPRPKIEISKEGSISISFDKEWTDMEKSNFLTDVKAKIVKNRGE